jgi:hypothetical protein
MVRKTPKSVSDPLFYAFPISAAIDASSHENVNTIFTAVLAVRGRIRSENR